MQTQTLLILSLFACYAAALVMPPPAPRLSNVRERHLRLALYQGPVKFGDTKANLELLEGLALQAGILGSDLLMVPELFLSGYTMFNPQDIQKVRSWALCRCKMPSCQIAEFSDGPAFQTVANIARMHNISILYACEQQPF